MIIATNKDTKDIYLRLNPTLDNPYFLFRLINNDTERVNEFFLEDQSSDGDIYNKFTINPETLNPSTYDYQVWETSVEDTNPDVGERSLLTIGLLKIVDIDDIESKDIYYKG